MRAVVFLCCISAAAAAPPSAGDPSADHGILFSPYAETIGEGNVSVDFYQLIGGIGVTYAPSDDLQFSLTWVPLLLAIEGANLGFFNVKYVAARSGPLRLAVDFESILLSHDGVVGALIGGALVGDLDLDPVVLHLGVGGLIAGGAVDTSGESTGQFFAGNSLFRVYAGATWYMIDWLALVSEAQSTSVASDSTDALLMLGLRCFGQTGYVTLAAGTTVRGSRAVTPILNGGFRF